MNHTLKVLLIVTGLALTLVIGYVFGNSRGADAGRAAAEKELLPVIDLAYPKPSAVAYAVSGTVRGVFTPTIHVEVIDPDDYLPHTDGSPRKTQIRYVAVTPETEIVLIDKTSVDAQGDLRRQAIDADDVREGDYVTIRNSAENIRNATKIDAEVIEVLR